MLKLRTSLILLLVLTLFLFFFLLGWSLQKSLRLRHRIGMKFDRNTAPIYYPSSTPSASQFPRCLASSLSTSTCWPCTQQSALVCRITATIVTDSSPYNITYPNPNPSFLLKAEGPYIRATYDTVIHFTDFAPGIDIIVIVIYWELF